MKIRINCIDEVKARAFAISFQGVDTSTVKMFPRCVEFNATQDAFTEMKIHIDKHGFVGIDSIEEVDGETHG